ncbi:predicted protein [Histoplasma capsulatum G186AR]|uniref:Uncharacterized protein n=1 Tax=Ajellomyces capsulatus (strain G186AR / H82 / ATCC MYA-2454 / RMSCC 2432) TaxID=447093 RepID=C0NAJ1_AJECG|nr:uncharacterized protein HCBG_00137 [Histoplasma capsulatum G186AR]EEH10682.1 predicted protein [Histoplasma capsulatum G186AR]
MRPGIRTHNPRKSRMRAVFTICSSLTKGNNFASSLVTGILTEPQLLGASVPSNPHIKESFQVSHLSKLVHILGICDQLILFFHIMWMKYNCIINIEEDYPAVGEQAFIFRDRNTA